MDPALADLCRTEHARLVGLLALQLGDRAVAEDLAQESLIRLHQHWPRVRTMASPTGWLYGVALNLSRSWWRRRFAERRALARTGTTPDAAVAAEPADVLAVRAAVAGLPRRQREALVLRYYGGLSVAEVARQMRCAEGTVKSLTSQAVDGLRRQFQEVP